MKTILLFILSCLAPWCYETVLFLPALIVITIIYQEYKDKKNITNIKTLAKTLLFKINIYYILSSISGVSLALFYKFKIHRIIFVSGPAKGVGIEQVSRNISLNKFIILIIETLSSMGPHGLYEYWKKMIGTKTITFILVITFILIFFRLITIILEKNKLISLYFSGKPWIDRKSKIFILFFGIILLTGSLSILMAVKTTTTFNPYGKANRILMLPSLGIALIIVGLLSYITGWDKYIFSIILSSILILNLLSLNQERLAYVRSWEYQSNFVENLSKNNDFSYFEDTKTFFAVINNKNKIELGIPRISDDWTMAHILGYLSKNRENEARLLNRPDFEKTLENIQKGNGLIFKNHFYTKENIYVLDLSNYKIVSLGSYIEKFENN
jgi:hypothetical protein